jgi:CheY-like chemotaxis protein
MPDVLVLVVDDEADIRATVSAMLEIEGYAVAEAANGADALHAVEQREPDVILLDMRMPVLDGWGFASEMRRARAPDPDRGDDGGARCSAMGGRDCRGGLRRQAVRARRPDYGSGASPPVGLMA